MKISGVGINKVANLYCNNKKVAETKRDKTNKDTIEISSLGKSLSSLSVEENTVNSSEKVEKIRKELSQGTYKVDVKLVAKKMIDAMKEKGV
jgi:negative regulator of flagellin synthesis FlgM